MSLAKEKKVSIAYNNYFQTVCGPDNLIYYASVHWLGSTHDSRVFHESSLRAVMEGSTLKATCNFFGSINLFNNNDYNKST